MKSNFTQAKSWIRSAINDVNRVLNGLKLEDYALVAFRSQFAVEKFNKSIISFIGVKVEKTHTPSEIIEDIINIEENLNLEEKTITLLRKIIKYSKTFENEGTKARYGVIKEEKLIPAEEIYESFENIKKFIIILKNYINCYITLLKESFNLSKKKLEDLKQLQVLIGDLDQWI